jgi:succinate--hydroxymethylglutarate CoA-transferase
VGDGELPTVSILFSIPHRGQRQRSTERANTRTASVVPYRAYKTKDTNIAVGGCNDKLYGILCDKLNKPEWKTDVRFLTNALRVTNRDTLDRIIEDELKTKTTKEWLDIFDKSGMPYAAVNDIQGTINHEQGMSPGTFRKDLDLVLIISYSTRA